MGSRQPQLMSLLAAVSAAALSACTVGPDYARPKLAESVGYAPGKPLAGTAAAPVAGGEAQRFVPGEDIPGEWWVLFHSATLNGLIEEAVKANPDVDAAQAALRQARETAYANQGALFPTVSGSASATREKQSAAALGGFGAPAGGGFSPTLSVTTASLNVSYAPDVFGGVRRQVESAEAQSEVQRFQLEATYLTLTSNVVNAAITVASLRAQIAATQDLVRIETDELELVKRQVALGAVNRSNLLTQQAQLDQTVATLPPLQKQLAQGRDQLMALLGRFPSQDRGENVELASLTLPQELPVSLPSQLVEQRPDVRAAEAQLRAASAQIGVAISNQLPQFTITGQLGASSTDVGQLFSPSSGIWSIAGSVAQTIFDGGQLEHRKRAAVAAYDQSAAQYRGVVLTGFQNVADSLHAIQTDADALKAEAQAERSALESLELARTQYRLSGLDYLSVLNAEQTYENAVLARVRAQAARYSDTVALFQALGGGWWNRADVAPASQGTPDRFALPPFNQVHLPTLRPRTPAHD